MPAIRNGSRSDAMTGIVCLLCVGYASGKCPLLIGYSDYPRTASQQGDKWRLVFDFLHVVCGSLTKKSFPCETEAAAISDLIHFDS